MKRGLLLAWLLAAGAVHAAAASLATLQAQVDAQVRAGYEFPDAALAELAALTDKLGALPADAPELSVLLLGRGLVVAGVGRAAEAGGIAAALAARPGDPLGPADADLVRALLAHTRGQVAVARNAAHAAWRVFEAECPARPACDHRSRWLALQMIARQEAAMGQPQTALEHALAAAELARGAGDAPRQAWALALAADLSATLGDGAGEKRLFGLAQQLAHEDGSPRLLSRIKIYETRLLRARGDMDGARQAAEQGLMLAAQALAPRQEALHLANLSDIHVRTGRPQEALQAVARALPVARGSGDTRAERSLLHNAALAHIALGQTEGARHTLDELLAAHAAAGADGDQAVVLREFADAFAAAGDLRTALDLYHRERRLALEIMAANRDAALSSLRLRNDREAQQRRLDQLGRDNALMAARLDNRAALQKVWVAGGVLLLLAMAFVGALYRHLRKINLSLAHNQEFLRAQSQRDPLTGLVNRRALHDRVAALGLERHFAGALLLVDIDHFKHVNDGHGHATGDLVLAELARRLAEVAGDDDLVVRWGGEEFLLFLPGRGPAQVQAMAARILQAVSGSPVDLPEGELRVTASVGFGCFPLAPARLPLSLERAVNLADMALYTAKNQGRNLAIGISEASATSADELHRLEADFDQAWQEGRVSLVRMWGTPAGADGTPQVAPAETLAAPAPQAVRRASPSSEMPA